MNGILQLIILNYSAGPLGELMFIIQLYQSLDHTVSANNF